MEATVRAKPIEFWMASAPPTSAGGHALAAIAENCGESAMTVAPQIRKKNSSQPGDNASAANGSSKQQAPEIASATSATRALPAERLSMPPRMQPTAPIPMIEKASTEMLSPPKSEGSDERAISIGNTGEKRTDPDFTVAFDG